MTFDQHCTELAGLSDLIVDEFKHAQKLLLCHNVLTETESEIVAKTIAAGVGQLAMLRMPLMMAALDLENEAAAKA